MATTRSTTKRASTKRATAKRPARKPAASKERYSEPAPPNVDIEAFRQVVTSRRSVRRFSDKAIPPEVLDDCIDLAMLAPNSSNLQPWAFYIVQSPKAKKALVAACLGQNAAKTAAELIVVVARTGTFRENARLNIERWPQGEAPKIVRDYYGKLVPLMYGQGPLGALGAVKGVASNVIGQFRPMIRGPASASDMKVWAVKSAALAAENLMLALRAHGFDSCPMEGFDEARVTRLLDLPSDALIPMVIAAGERAPDGIYHPRLRFERERFVFRI